MFSNGETAALGPLAVRLIIDSDNGRIYDAPVEGEVVLHLPYGKYPILYSSRAFEPVSRSIVVNRPEQLVVLPLALSHFVGLADGKDVGPDPVAIHAKVQPVTSCLAGRPLWAKIVGVYSDYIEVRKIQPDGSVLFDGLDDGLYVFMVLDGNRLRSTQTVTAVGKVTLDIKLQDCANSQ